VLLRREGWSVNLQMPLPRGTNQSWSMDYVADGLIYITERTHSSRI
jgi:hypothetical protein